MLVAKPHLQNRVGAVTRACQHLSWTWVLVRRQGSLLRAPVADLPGWLSWEPLGWWGEPRLLFLQ